jgi:hypothetical protein
VTTFPPRAPQLNILKKMTAAFWSYYFHSKQSQ